MPYLGPDPCDLIKRTATGGVDTLAQPAYAEQVIPKLECCITILDGSSVSSAPVASAGIGGADTPEGSVAIFAMKGMLPVDADTTALTGDDALRFNGVLYELSRPADTKYLLSGEPDHVRVFGTAMTNTAKSSEQVVITPRGGRDDSGQPQPDGEPYTVMAYAVTADSSEAHYWVSGEIDTDSFTVALPLTAPIRDQDWVEVRGRIGTARVRTDLNRWVDRNVRVVSVQSTYGGRRPRGGV